MKTSSFYLGLVLIAAAFGTGCATGADKRVDQQVSNEKIQTNQQLRTEAKQIIEETPGLSPDQRSRLDSLRIQTQNDMAALNAESVKLRAVLIENVFSKKERSVEVKTIKSRLKKVEDKKLEVTFNAVDKAYTILGKQAVDNQRMMIDMLNERRNAL